jgi:hypothetical protein
MEREPDHRQAARLADKVEGKKTLREMLRSAPAGCM